MPKPKKTLPYLAWLQRRSRWQRWGIYAVTIFLILLSLHAALEASFKEVERPTFGVTFSQKYAQELGVDWQANYLALLDDLQIRRFRLMSYWDTTEPSPGVFRFEDLDWQMDQAAQRGAKVSLTLGMRQPRWPECYTPTWYAQLSKAEKAQALLDFVAATVQRYRGHPALETYQLENEAVNNWFGECSPEDIDQARLAQEFALVKKLDPHHPVWMSLSDQHGLPLGKPVPDKYGYSVYRILYNTKTAPLKFYITYPTPVWYHRLRALWIRTFKHRDIFIHELQMEPWGPQATVKLSVAEQNRSMDIEQISKNFTFARKIGAPEIYTWGGEWWYWRKVNLHDPTVWEKVRSELQRP